MALVTAKRVSRLTVPLLRRSLVLPRTVSRPPGSEFAGDNGDTITVRVRQPRTASIQSSPGADVSGDFSSFDETGVDVTLTHLFDGANISDEELSLEIVDFATQVSEPQISAVATGAEDELAGAMNDLATDNLIAADPSSDDIDDALRETRETLTRAEVPNGARWLAVSPEFLSAVLGVDKFVRADATGDSTALREAVAGRIYGMQVVESAGLDALTAVAYHMSGFAFANRAPIPPRGASQSASAAMDGVALRQIFQYNPNSLSDQSVVSTFAGASVVDADRVVKLEIDTAA